MLDGKVAIVTGGTRGIGYETVRTFLNNSAKVILFGSNGNSVNNAINKLKEENKDYEVMGLYPNLTHEKEIKEALKTVGTDKVQAQGHTLTASEGTLLDFGAIGKGFACDLIHTYLQETDINGAVISVGGSIVAFGDYNKKGDKWRIAITHPRKADEYLGVISLDEGFVSTSGDYERYFEKDGKRYHHIFDAETGYPSESGLVSVTVVCDNGLLSDALSTACFVLGKDEGMKLAEKYGASAVFQEQSEVSFLKC